MRCSSGAVGGGATRGPKIKREKVKEFPLMTQHGPKKESPLQMVQLGRLRRTHAIQPPTEGHFFSQLMVLEKVSTKPMKKVE